MHGIDINAAYTKLAVDYKESILITNFLDLKKTTSGSNIRFSDVIHTVHNGSTSSTGDTVVISFSDTAESGDIALQQVMLCEIYKQH